MATVTQLKDRIKRRLSRVALANLDSLIIDEMTHAQVEILEAEAWLPHFLKGFIVITVTGSHYSLVTGGTLPGTQSSLPTGFIRLLEPTQEHDSLTYLNVDRYDPIPRFDSFRQLKQKHGDGPDRADVPGGYYWDGNPEGTLQLRPQTNGTVQYLLNYYRHDPNTPASPASGDVTLWTKYAGDYLMHTTGVEVATYLRDTAALEYFASKRQEAFNRLQKQKTAADMGDTEMVMGDD
jgi:hypothetical protein